MGMLLWGIDGGREQLVRAMARGRVVRPRDDDQFFECETAGEFGESRRHGVAGSDDCLVAQRLDHRALGTRVRISRRVLGRYERLANPLLESDAPELARLQQAPGFGVGIRCDREHAYRRLRVRMAGTRPVIAPVQRERFFDTAPFAEKIRERIWKAEMRGKLRAVVRAAENPDLRTRRTGRVCLDRRERVTFVERL